MALFGDIAMRQSTLSLTRNLRGARYKYVSSSSRLMHSTPLEKLLVQSIKVCTAFEHEKVAQTPTPRQQVL